MSALSFTATFTDGKAVHDAFVAVLSGEESLSAISAAFATWQSENADGFYIRDLDQVCEIIGLLIEGSDRFQVKFNSILCKFLDICAKPLMELKANERLSSIGLAKIEKFYSTVSHMWGITEVVVKLRLGKTMRCVVHGGKDPSQLRCDHKEYQPDGMRLRVTDTSFINKVLRESSALETITYEFLNSADVLKYVPNEPIDPEEVQLQTLRNSSFDDPELYGLPPKQPQLSIEEIAESVAIQVGAMPDSNGPPSGILPESSPMQSSVNESPVGKIRSRSFSRLSVADDKPANTRDLSQIMLDLCLDLSMDAENAAQMFQMGLVDGIVTTIEKDFRYNPREARLSFLIELLWNVLEHFMDSAKHLAGVVEVTVDRRYLQKYERLVDFERTIDVLMTLANYTLISGYRLSDKELRNEVVIILTMLANFPGAIGHFIHFDVLTWLLTYACIEEMGRESWHFFTKTIANSRNFATVSDIDIEFKKCVWFLVSELLAINDPDALLCFSSSPYLACMLAYMEADSFDNNHKKVAEGSLLSSNQKQQPQDDHHYAGSYYSAVSMQEGGDAPIQAQVLSKSTSEGLMKPSHTLEFTNTASLQQPSITSKHSVSHRQKGFIAQLPLSKLRELQLLAVRSLVHNAPKVLGEFERLDGPTRIIASALRYCRSDVQEHRELLFHSFVLLNRCLNNSTTVRQYLEDNNIIQTFLYVFGRSEHEETRAQLVRLISTLCSGGNAVCQRQVKLLGGITDMIFPLQQYVRNLKPMVGTKAGLQIQAVRSDSSATDALPDPLENPFGGEISILVVAILDALNNAVVGNPINEAFFAESEGMDALLDMLETSSFVLRLQILRLLANILKNSKLVSFVNAWRSPKTLRSAAQLLCHCWLDEEARLDCARVDNGVLSDIWHPLANHQWPVENINPQLAEQQKEAEAAATLKSLTVTKLATAILAGRNALQTNLPVVVCEQALENDTRVILSSALGLLGIYELYNVHGHRNPCKTKVNQFSLVKSTHITSAGEELCVYEDGMASPTSPASIQYQQTSEFRTTSLDNMSNDFSPTAGSFKKNLGFEGSTASMASGAPAGAVLQSSNDLGLTPRDRQALAMAKVYGHLREGEWWREVHEEMHRLHIVPIEADAALLDTRLEFAFDAAQAVQVEQMELYDEDQKNKKDTEDTFINQIITKKEQQIKAEWLKKNGKNKAVPVSKRTGSAKL